MKEYFSHDYNTRGDEKILDLMSKFGWEGYGIYWGIVELLYQNNGNMQTDFKRIAFALNTHESEIESIVKDFDLFSVNDTHFYSESVINRLYLRNMKSVKARESANARWGKANAKRTHSDSNAKKESKVKEINIEDRLKLFKETIKPYIDKEFSGRLFTIDDARSFLDYWGEPNQANTKLKYELERTWSIKGRISRWMKPKR